MPGSFAQFSTEIADVVQSASESIITVLEGGREGVSGTEWRDGFAITADHTIRALDEVTVILPSGTKIKARVAGRDHGTDIAILQINNVSPVRIADDAAVRVGEAVLAVARRASEGVTMSAGSITAVGGPRRTWKGAKVERWLRTDLTPFPGFSGGPVVNARGEAIGMALSGPRRSAMILPASTINRVVDELARHGRIRRGYLGIAMQPVVFPDAARQSLGISGHRGLLVVSLAPGGPAEKSGLLLGDIIVSVSGSPIEDGRSLQPLTESEQIGQEATLDVIRGGQRVQVAITVGEEPQG